jgi:hypothetical protein
MMGAGGKSIDARPDEAGLSVARTPDPEVS